MRGLLILERVVLESLSRKENDIEGIVIDTNIKRSLLKKILASLLMRGIILKKNQLFSLNFERQKEWMDEINNDCSIRNELSELFHCIVGNYFDREVKNKEVPILKIQKIWMSESEEKIYNSLLYNLQSFIEGLKRQQKAKKEFGRTCQQRVAFWGHLPYEMVISRQIGV